MTRSWRSGRSREAGEAGLGNMDFPMESDWRSLSLCLLRGQMSLILMLRSAGWRTRRALHTKQWQVVAARSGPVFKLPLPLLSNLVDRTERWMRTEHQWSNSAARLPRILSGLRRLGRLKGRVWCQSVARSLPEVLPHRSRGPVLCIHSPLSLRLE